jgi:CubicO group peptidase (beta-lactamase class C family)
VDASAVMEAILPFVWRGDVPGAIVGLLCGGVPSMEAAGVTAPGERAAVAVDSLARISSNTKPLVAAAALSLAEDGLLRLDDPVERFVPELAGRRVLRRLDSALGDTVPAARSVTVEDLLTMRLGFGFVFECESPAVAAAAAAGLGIGPPDPSVRLTSDEWIARFAQLPLLEQPGQVWRYDLAYAVLGVVLARATGQPLDLVLGERLFDPLGMVDTGFVAGPGRLLPCFAVGDGGLVLFDGAADSRWSSVPRFLDARGGLVSTATDLLRFAASLLQGGGGVLSPQSVEQLTADRLTPEQRRAPSAEAFLGGSGWGYGVEVVGPEQNPSVRHRRYGWGGGLGTLWYSWPDHETAAVLLTQVLPPSPELIGAFIEGVEGILGG